MGFEELKARIIADGEGEIDRIRSSSREMEKGPAREHRAAGPHGRANSPCIRDSGRCRVENPGFHRGIASVEMDEPVIPEPATVALLGLGLATAGIAVRRRRR